MTQRIATGLTIMLLTGCSLTGGLARQLSDSMLNHPDPATVAAASPAFLLMIDALIASDDRNVELLRTGARLYGAFAGTLETEPERRRVLAQRSWDYAKRALCEPEAQLCGQLDQPFDSFSAFVARASDANSLYGLGVSWAGRIQADPGNWRLVADLPKVEALMLRSLELDPALDAGGPHAYLGVLNSLRPPALGGRPEVGRAHFEQALALSGGHNLMFKVLFARHYARLVFDQALHDQLIAEVMQADPEADQLTLINRLAQQEAAKLAADSATYF